jgi:beta-phosphoglucomutase
MSFTNGYGVIWDVDGTLVDTAEQHFDAWVKLCAERGREFTRADFTATFGRRNPEILHYLFGDTLSEAEIDELGYLKETYYRDAARHGVSLLPGVRALVEGLHTAGFRQATGSSAPRGNLDLLLGLTGIEPFFNAIVAMEDTQRGKPDPQVFQVAAEKLGVADGHCLVLEDAVAGIQAAKAAGMKCIAVSFVGHHSEEKLRAAGADLVVKNLELVTVDTVRQLLTI